MGHPLLGLQGLQLEANKLREVIRIGGELEGEVGNNRNDKWQVAGARRRNDVLNLCLACKNQYGGDIRRERWYCIQG